MKFSRAASNDVVSLFCCLAVAGAAIFLAVAGGPSYLGSLDFRVYLTAGQMTLDGTGAQFYDLGTQFQTQRGLWPQMTQQKQLLPFLAPPFVGVLFAPLALLSPLQGYCVWTVFNAFLAWILVREILAFLRLEGRQNLIALALLLTFAPIVFAVMQGQVSLLVVLAFWKGWKAAKIGSGWQAGIWLSLLWIRPQLALLPLLIFACKGRWRLVGGLGVGALTLGGISLWLVGWPGLQLYANLLGAVSNWQGIYGVQPTQMQTWRGFLHAVLATNDAAAVRWPWILGVFTALLAVFFCWRGPWNAQSPRFERQWATMGIGALFCCPYLYAHDLSLLTVCGALIFGAARLEKSALTKLPLFGYCVVVAWAVSLAIWPRTWPWVALLEAVALAILVWNDINNHLLSASIPREI